MRLLFHTNSLKKTLGMLILMAMTSTLKVKSREIMVEYRTIFKSRTSRNIDKL